MTEKNLKEVRNMSMTKEEVKDKMQDHNVVVLNVLPDNDYAKMHIAGSEMEQACLLYAFSTLREPSTIGIRP